MTSALAVQPIEIYWSNGEINPTAEKLPVVGRTFR